MDYNSDREYINETPERQPRANREYINETPERQPRANINETPERQPRANINETPERQPRANRERLLARERDNERENEMNTERLNTRRRISFMNSDDVYVRPFDLDDDVDNDDPINQVLINSFNNQEYHNESPLSLTPLITINNTQLDIDAIRTKILSSKIESISKEIIINEIKNEIKNEVIKQQNKTQVELTNEEIVRITDTITIEKLKDYCTCRICFSHFKNIILHPCNHRICSMCLNNPEIKSKCPFCNTPVTGKSVINETLENIDMYENVDNIKEEITKMSERLFCNRCNNNVKNVIFKPCNHIFCINCVMTQTDNKCTQCNVEITDIDLYRKKYLKYKNKYIQLKNKF
jgi:hypothetical protein